MSRTRPNKRKRVIPKVDGRRLKRRSRPLRNLLGERLTIKPVRVK